MTTSAAAEVFTINIIPITQTGYGSKVKYVQIGDTVQKQVTCDTCSDNGHLILHKDFHPDLNNVQLYSDYQNHNYVFTNWDSYFRGGFDAKPGDIPAWNADGLKTNDTSHYLSNYNDRIYIIYTLSKKTLRLTYDANAGSDAVTDLPEVTKVSVNTLEHTFNVSPQLPKREGYQCLGWATTKTATTPDVGPTITVNKSTTLYAVWREENETPAQQTHTVTYDANANGNPVDGLPEAQTQTTTDSTFTFTVSTLRPTRDGFEFIGWTTDSSSSSANVGSTIEVSGSQTIYAVWQQKTETPENNNKSHVLIYNANGGDINSIPANQTVDTTEDSYS